jgi:hypothetical protein
MNCRIKSGNDGNAVKQSGNDGIIHSMFRLNFSGKI